MFNRLFVDHPRSVDENYVEHFAVASKFGLTMIRGGICALIHALVPGWCVTTGSDTIQRLNRIMVEQRRAKGRAVMELQTVDWVI
ncbi:hypothetical protein GCM10011515_23040 [Tsuneonella deserti]|uniref:Capsule biosynthesis protein n=1 Tax=Tsuneonella deserti TaxID=2035528 RepID=A0ABQ1SAC5_9SPHN|nr:DUF6356 family protein [Tsuneonella deserti]GGE02830.1 hypothetical protein GCM10011515_23040 [Tsuneonella deserti]